MIKAQSRKGRDEMKKHLTIFAATAALAAMLAGCSQTVQGGTQMSYIGAEAAENMAVTAAQVNKEDATFAQTELDDKDGTVYYDVEFVVDGTHYTYAIDALTGAVIESESEAALYGDGQTGDTATQTAGAVDEAKAKQIALDHAGVKEADAAYLQVKADRDDGVSVYDVEFYVASTNTEYDYEISGTDGTILKRESESHAVNASSVISAQAARDAALAHAGLSASDVWELEVDEELDDDRPHYDVEFKSGNMDYEYEIDAVSGSVLHYEKERD